MEVLSTSRLTKKYQATVPAPVRKALGLRAGDAITFEVKGNRVTLGRTSPLDVEYLKAVESTMTEWLSKEDEDAYGDL